MKKILIGVLTLIILVGGFALISSSGNDKSSMNGMDMSSNSSQSNSQATEPNTVTMKNIDYTVKELTVKKGTTVTWRNDDTAQHDVNFDDQAMDSADSKLLDQGQTYQYTFNEVGTFNYHCTPHPFMKAKVVVTE